MKSIDLTGKRILVTQADTFMGPTLCEVLAEMGAEVIADNQLLADPALPAKIIEAAGSIDVLVINLADSSTF
jgi:NAD(P)-dependent dehydrogenase (short-subunit alcohol dehydrogenase family)